MNLSFKITKNLKTFFFLPFFLLAVVFLFKAGYNSQNSASEVFYKASDKMLVHFSPEAGQQEIEKYLGKLDMELVREPGKAGIAIVKLKKDIQNSKMVAPSIIISVEPIKDAPAGPAKDKIDEKVKEKVKPGGSANVLVTLQYPVSPGAEKFYKKYAVNYFQEEVLNLLGDKKPYHKYDYIPAFSITLTQKEVELLEKDPRVKSIRLNRQTHLISAESLPLVNADIVHAAPYDLTGQGMTMAILDTGIDTDHIDFTHDNAIKAEKCFTSDIYDDQEPPQLITGADCQGDDPTESDNAEDYHGHGTNVAGIVTSPNGFAPDAKVVPIRVTNDAGFGTLSDWVRALDWIITNQEELNVNTVNISMEVQETDGSGLFFDDHVTCDNQFPNLKNAIDQLNQMGVQVFAGTGNRGNSSGISAPACLSNVIAVGATYDSDMGREPDVGTFRDPGTGSPNIRWGDCYDTLSYDTSNNRPYVTCFSNTSTNLGNIVMAPGSKIMSTNLGGGQSEYYGTSQASPIAASIGTLMLQIDGNLTNDDIKTILKTTGNPVYKTGGADEFKLIDALQAIEGTIAPECQAVIDIPKAECMALRSLYINTNGDGWATNTDWLQTDTACIWHGITCSNNHISAINLPSNNLSGTIPVQIQLLKQLETLVFNSNGISGQIPEQLYSLTNLTNLNLSQNDLSGEIDHKINNLVQLTTLNLGDNNLQNVIPQELGNLTNLQSLDLSNNLIDGNIPVNFENLSGLSTLHLFNNKLEGLIPIGLGNLSSLTSLYLQNNSLSGIIPADLCNYSPSANFGYNMFTDSDVCISSLDPDWEQTQTVPPANLSVLSTTDKSINLTWNTIPYTGDTGYYEIVYEVNLTGSYKRYVKTSDKTENTITLDDLMPQAEYIIQARTYTSAHGEQKNNLESIESYPISGTTNGTTVCQGATQVPEIECRALEMFYKKTNGDSWQRKYIWLENLYPCSWYGIDCLGNNVSGITLPDNLISGSLPKQIGYLSELDIIFLSNNQIGGEIPPDIGKLDKLTIFWMSDSNVSGNIPAEIGTMSNLEEIYLENNFLTGNIPPEIGSLTNLRSLSLYNNQLTGNIPGELGNLSDLSILYLDMNNLNGNFPSQICNLTNLTELYLGDNKLNGNIPSTIGNLTALEWLYINNNKLNGQIPQGIGNLVNLSALHLEKNQLSGDIPVELMNLSNWTIYGDELDIGYNMLSATDPNLINFLDQRDPDWNLTQTIPPDRLHANPVSGSNVYVSWSPILFQSISGYYQVFYSSAPGGPYGNLGCAGNNKAEIGCIVSGLSQDIQYYFAIQTYTEPHGTQQNELFSALSEEVSTQISNSPVIDILEPDGVNDTTVGPYEIQWVDYDPDNNAAINLYYDSDNSGQDGTIISDCDPITEDDETDSCLWNTGIVPEGDYYIYAMINDWVNPTGVDYSDGFVSVDHSATSFCSTVEEIPEIECEALISLYNSTNGDLWDMNTGWLQTSTPCTWYGITCSGDYVTSIDLFSNNLSGNIPQELGDLSNLIDLSLDHNSLAGNIPPELGNLSNLQTLELTSNSLYGDISPELGYLFSLKTLDLADNSLTWEIPSELGNLINLENLHLDLNQLNGPVPQSFGNLINLQTLTLWDNSLTGSIPQEIGNLHSLQLLDLTSNKLSGAIPPILGNITTLNDLLLPGNRIEGAIPSSLCISGLSADFSYNMFTSADICIDNIDPDWANTQTVPPERIIYAMPVTFDSISVSWDPVWYEIEFLNNYGYYQVMYSLNPGGPYENFGCKTQNIIEDNCDVNGLMQNTPYYFAVQTFTEAWDDPYYTGEEQKNDLLSIFSDEALAEITDSPFIKILESDGENDIADTSFEISWADSDLDDNAILSLYFDNDNTGEDGTLIAGSIDEDDPGPGVTEEIDKYVWDTSTMPEGNIYIYAIIDDGSNPPVTDYSHGMVTIDHTVSNFDCASVNEIPNTECEALVELYYSTSGANWTDNTGWLRNNLPCSWFGISCISNNVTEINLGRNLLLGTFPQEIGNLQQLRKLNLWSNQLEGNFPIEIGNLALLQYLNLNENNLTGNLPSELGNLSNLTELNLNANKFYGSIPSQLGNLGYLNYLYLGSNRFSGQVPGEFGNLSNIRRLYLDNNQLSGTIPVTICGLTVLSSSYTDFGYNMFTYADTCIKNKDADWDQTQTILPANITVSISSDNSATFQWAPIIYQEHGGYYKVSYSNTQGGPYITTGCQTGNKSGNSCTTGPLMSNTEYFFVVQAFTPPHFLTEIPRVTFQQNELWSENSTELPIILASNVYELITAIEDVNLSGQQSFIYLHPNTKYTLTQINNNTNGDNGLPSITGDITIIGSGATIERDSLNVDTPYFRIFNITPVGKLKLVDLKIKFGDADNDSGAAIRNEGELIMENVTISQNIAQSGGGILNIGQATILDSIIEYNMAFGSGGGIDNLSGAGLSLLNSTLENNIAGSGGGGINNVGTISANNTEIKNNLGASGGGINNGGDATITGSSVTGNSTIDPNLTNDPGTGICNHEDPYKGGGICNYGTLNITGSILQSNASINKGGGIYNDSTAGSTVINNSCIMSNAAATNDAITNDSITLMDATGNWWGYPAGATPTGVIGGYIDTSLPEPNPILGCGSGIVHDDINNVKVLQSLPYEDNEYIDSSLQPLGALTPSCGTNITKGIYYRISDDKTLAETIIGRARIGGIIGRSRIGGIIGRSRIGGIIGRSRIGGIIGRDKFRFNLSGEGFTFTPVVSIFAENDQSILEEISCSEGLYNITKLDISMNPGINHYIVIGFRDFDNGLIELKSESLHNPLPVEVTDYNLAKVQGTTDNYYLNLHLLNVRDYGLNNLQIRLLLGETSDKAVIINESAAISSILQGETAATGEQLLIQLTQNYTQGDTVKFYIEITEQVEKGGEIKNVISTIPIIIPQKLKFEFWDFNDEEDITDLPTLPPLSDPRYMDDELLGLEEYAVRWLEDIDLPYSEYYSLTREKGGELSEQFYNRMTGKLTGYFYAEYSDPYEFYLTVEDGASLLIDGNIVINDTGARVMEDGSVNGNVTLTEGWHAIEIQYFEDIGGNGLKLEYKDPLMSVEEIIPSRLFTNNLPPEIQVTEPDGTGDLAEDSFTISWLDNDDNSSAEISIYYDTNSTGSDGTLIAAGISQDEPENSFTWDTSLIDEGTYYIYGVINDGINPQVIDYSPYPVLVNRQGACPSSLCNGDFESGTDLEYWHPGNGINQIVTDAVQDGAKAYYTEHTFNVAQNPRWSGAWQNIMIESAQTYGLTGFYKSENAAQGHIKITWKDTKGAVLQVNYPITNINGTNSNWIEFSKLVIAPAGAFTAEIKIWHGVNTSSQNVLGSKLWIDSLSFDVATTACGTLCNESFEHGILYWIQSGAAGSHTIEQTDVHEGLKTLRSEQLYTSGDETKWAGITQYAQVKEGINYRLRLWLKTENTSNGHVRIRWRDDGGNLLSTQYPIVGINGTTLTWFKRETNVSAPVNASRAEIAIWHGVVGLENFQGSTLWMDDITMICLTLCNGGFEDGNIHWETNGINEGEIVGIDVQEGSQALKIAQELDPSVNAQWAGISQRALVTGGSSYNLSFWLKKENAVQGHVKIKWRDADDHLISQQFPIGGINGTNLTWTQMSTALNAPPNAETAEMFIWHGVDSSNQNATGSTLHLDNIIFEQVP